MPESNETLKGSPTKFSQPCDTKKFRRKILILPYPQTFSLPEFFWNTAQKGSPKKSFGTVRQKKFDGKC